MLKPLIILGAGGSGFEIVEIVMAINEVSESWNIIGFLDDDKNLHGTSYLNVKVLGSLDCFIEYPGTYFASSIGHPEKRFLRNQIRNKIEVSDDYFPPFAHPKSSISKSAKIGCGTIICAGCVLGANSKIGKNVFINYGSTVGHESIVDDFSILGSGVNISGENSIGSHVYIGAGSVTKHNIQIGNNVLVGIGSSVIRSIPDNKKFLQDHRTFILSYDDSN